MVIQTIKGLLGSRPLIWVSPEANLEEAFDVLGAEGINALVVLSDGELCGIITERDIIRHVSQRGGFSTDTVSQAMTREVTWVATNCSILEAQQRMLGGGFRQVPVRDMGQKIVGLLTLHDIPAEQSAFSRPRPATAPAAA